MWGRDMKQDGEMGNFLMWDSVYHSIFCICLKFSIIKRKNVKYLGGTTN